MTTAETYLLAAVFVLLCALVIAIALGRIDARDADQLAAERDRLTEDLECERAKVRHYRDRNTDLRAEMDSLHTRGGRHLADSWMSYVNDLPLTSPEDLR